MKFKTIIFFSFLMSSIHFFGQIKISETAYKEYVKIPQEKIYVHYNSNFLLTGENLNYKIYCLNYDTNFFSNLSSIAYIELINSNKESVLKQKIKLKNGIGQGDAFIATNLTSGNYKLIAYTEWMKNKNSFFGASINIINPFINKIVSVEKKESNKSNSNNYTDTSLLNTDNNYIKTNKNNYSKREKVTIQINEDLKKESNQNLSISVRKIMPNFPSKKIVPFDFINSKKTKITANFNSENKVFLPELRGELIQGKIIALDNKSSIENIKIGLSIIQKNGIYKIVNTNKNGTFYFNLSEEYTSEKAYIQVLENNRNNYKITISENKNLNLNSLKFTPLKVSPEIAKSITDRAIYLQIENGYNELNKDTTIPFKKAESLFKNSLIIYKLDDYTRFKTIKETIVEVIKNTWLTKDEDNYTFHVRDIDLQTNYQNKPLILIDGYIINNHNELVNLNPKKIEQIGIVRNKYKFGANIYQGVISVKTFEANYSPNHKEPFLSLSLSKPLPIKKYFYRNYSNLEFKRIPDYRTQLLWQPSLDLNQKEISFFTSDVTGNFEVILEGFSNKGKPIYQKLVFTVK